MKSWSEAAGDALISGTLGSAVSTIAMAAEGQKEEGTPYAPVNAVSHWFFGDAAAAHDAPSARHTTTGYAIHHAAATLWAVVYEKWFGRSAEQGQMVVALAGGMAVAGLACFVDYQLTPCRLRPGYEKRLSRRALLSIYASLGAGLVLRGLAQGKLKSAAKHQVRLSGGDELLH